MKYLFLFLIIVFNHSTFAHTPAHLKDVAIVRENLDLVDSLRFGYFELRDVWGKFTVLYASEFNPAAELDTWETDEKFDIAHHDKLGYGIVRYKDKMFYKMIIAGEYDPIEEKQQDCLKKADTTAAMVKCYKTSALEWRTEYLFSYRHLQKTLPEDIAKLLEGTEKELETLTNSYFKAYKKYLDHMGGPYDI